MKSLKCSEKGIPKTAGKTNIENYKVFLRLGELLFKQGLIDGEEKRRFEGIVRGELENE